MLPHGPAGGAALIDAHPYLGPSFEFQEQVSCRFQGSLCCRICINEVILFVLFCFVQFAANGGRYRHSTRSICMCDLHSCPGLLYTVLWRCSRAAGRCGLFGSSAQQPRNALIDAHPYLGPSFEFQEQVSSSLGFRAL
jgi:hypothetical protein